jgi:hypothetical protein
MLDVCVRMEPPLRIGIVGFVVSLLVASAHAHGAVEASNTSQEWELVRSVSSPYGGTVDLVLIPENKQRDRDYYATVANVVCGDRTKCVVNFWTDKAHIPSSANMPVVDLAVMTGSYERHPNYKAPVLGLACWLYPNREIGEPMNCRYFPGAKVPWAMPK